MILFADSQSELWLAVNRIAEDEGLSLYDLERTPLGLRVFVERHPIGESTDNMVEKLECTAEICVNDARSTQEAVSSEDCARLSRRLVTFFTVKGSTLGIGDELALEVSSPGINRHLRLISHFKNVVGQRIKIQFRDPEGSGLESAPSARSENKKTIWAILDRVEGNTLIFRCPEGVAEGLTVSEGFLEVNLDSVIKARVDFAFPTPGAKKSNRKSHVQKNNEQKDQRKSKKVRH